MQSRRPTEHRRRATAQRLFNTLVERAAKTPVPLSTRAKELKEGFDPSQSEGPQSMTIDQHLYTHP